MLTFLRRVKRSVAFRLRRRTDQIKHFAVAQLAQVNESPVFVVGNQKSGTTAIAALLAEHAGLSSQLDFGYSAGRRFPDLYDGSLALEDFIREHSLEFSHDLIKAPSLTFLLPKLRDRFPRSRWVMIVRDPRDNIRSILDRLKMPGDCPTVDLAQYAEVRRGWKNVIWNAGLDLPGGTYIERLAHRWRYAAMLYQRYAAGTRLVRYEDFCERKEETIASLAQRLGLPGRNDIADKVDEQYQPRGSNREASWEEFFGAANLDRIESICREPMEKLAYASCQRRP